jgi:membrane-bound metal-dependent hydrolase YbcI (DUF457 family)
VLKHFSCDDLCMFSLTYLRMFRIEGFALFDLGVSFLGMALLAPLLSRLALKLGYIVPKVNWVWMTLTIGIIAHLLTGQMTPMTREFLNPSGDYVLKGIVLVTFALGCIGIKKLK